MRAYPWRSALRLQRFSLRAAARATGIEPVSLVEMTAAGPLCQTRFVADGRGCHPVSGLKEGCATRPTCLLGTSGSGVGKKSHLGISY